LTALLNAAKEGKGISDIQTWEEDYEHEETEDAGASSRAELAEQDIDEHDHDELIHRAEEELQNEGLDNELAESRHHEDEVHEVTQHDDQEGLVDPHEQHQAGVESTEIQQYHDEEEDGELNTVNNESHELAETQANLERLDNIEETEPLHTSDKEPIAETEYQHPQGSTTGPGVDETASDTGFAGDAKQEYSMNEIPAVPDSLDSHVEQDEREEDASAENKPPTAELIEASEAATAAEQYNETGGYEDEEEALELEEGEYDEDAGEGNYEDYGEEEYQQDAPQDEDDEELAAGDGENGEFQEGRNDGSYMADQFDQASSTTVSALNEPVDTNDESLDILQTGTKTNVTEGLDYAQDIPDLPDLPDDDLLDLDDDIFADTEQVTHGETEEDNGPDASHIDEGHDASVEQATAFNDDQQQNVQLKRQGSTVGKRSRSDEEEEIDFDGVPSPGAKRTRSS
jgi:hypothetical protein